MHLRRTDGVLEISQGLEMDVVSSGVGQNVEVQRRLEIVCR